MFSLLALPERDASKTENPLFSFWRIVACFLLLFAIFLGGVWRLEVLTEPPTSKKMHAQKRPPCRRGKDGRLPRRCRAFVVMVDSLRTEAAFDKKMMPQLVELSKTGGFGLLQSCKDHVTAPCVRASMEGRYRSSIFSIIQNFSTSQAGKENILLQAQQKGFRIYGASHDRCFGQFGRALVKNEPWVSDHSAMNHAIKAYKSGKYDVILLHILEGDHAAHAYGIYHSAYKRTFSYIDSQIAQLNRLVHPDEHFLVYGDHGHTPDGSHKFGMETPSYYWVRGPVFRKNLRQKAHIKDIRFFLSEIFALPLPTTYQGEVFRHLLKGSKLPRNTKHVKKNNTSSIRVSAGLVRKVGFWTALWLIGLGLLLWFWLQLRVKDPELPTRDLWMQVGIGSAALLLGLMVNSILTFVVAVGVLLYLLKDHLFPITPHKALSGMFVFLPAAFAIWGKVLFLWRPQVHAFWWRHTMSYMFLIGCGFALMGTFLPLRYGLNLLWVSATFLLIPTVYWYGAMSSVFLMLSAFTLFLLFRPPSRFGENAYDRFPAIFAAKVLALVCLIPLQIFIYIESESFLFTTFLGWRLYIVNNPKLLTLFAGWPVLPSIDVFAIPLMFIIAKAVVYYDGKLRTAPWLAGLGMALWVGFAEFRSWHKLSLLFAAVMGVLLFVVISIYKKERSWKEALFSVDFPLRRLMTLAFFQFLMVFLYRVPVEHIIRLNIFLAFFELISRSVRLLGDKELLRVAPIMLAVLGYLGSFWFSLRWGLGNLEWTFAYDWLTSTQVEFIVLPITLLNVLKYVLPMLMVRLVLQKHFPNRLPQIQHRAHVWIGIKLVSLLGICYGFAASDYATRIFDESIQQLVITLFSLSGVLL